MGEDGGCFDRQLMWTMLRNAGPSNRIQQLAANLTDMEDVLEQVKVIRKDQELGMDLHIKLDEIAGLVLRTQRLIGPLYALIEELSDTELTPSEAAMLTAAAAFRGLINPTDCGPLPVMIDSAALCQVRSLL